MSDGVLTRALSDLERAGIPLAAVLDPAKRATCLRAVGISLKTYGRLQEAAIAASALHQEAKTGRTITVSLRMTANQRAKLASLGGAKWVREKIDSEGTEP